MTGLYGDCAGIVQIDCSQTDLNSTGRQLNFAWPSRVRALRRSRETLLTHRTPLPSIILRILGKQVANYTHIWSKGERDRLLVGNIERQEIGRCNEPILIITLEASMHRAYTDLVVVVFFSQVEDRRRIVQ